MLLSFPLVLLRFLLDYELFSLLTFVMWSIRNHVFAFPINPTSVSFQRGLFAGSLEKRHGRCARTTEGRGDCPCSLCRARKSLECVVAFATRGKDNVLEWAVSSTRQPELLHPTRPGRMRHCPLSPAGCDVGTDHRCSHNLSPFFRDSLSEIISPETRRFSYL